MRIDHIVRATSVGFPSGQRDQTVNLTRKLRWFESSPHHQYFDSCRNGYWSKQVGLVIETTCCVAGIVQW